MKSVFRNTYLPLLAFVLGLFPILGEAQDTHPAAPLWDVSQWINGPGVNVDKLRGKVVIVEFFQLWCPGCNRFSIPLMKKWAGKYADQRAANKLFMVSIHTVFEGHDYQSPERLRAFVKQNGMTHLVGVDRHKGSETIPETMRRYRTRGTPEMAIIDKNGRIRFQKFGGFKPELAEHLIDQLLQE